MTAQEKLFPSFDEIITHIYQGSLEPTPWKSFLRCLLQHMNCDAAAMILLPSVSDSMPFSLYESKDSLSRQTLTKAAGHACCPNPLIEALPRAGDIMTIEEALPRSKLVTSDYYLKVMRPLGMEHMQAMRIAGNNSSHFLFLLNSSERGAFSASSREHLHALRPHLEHALKTLALLKRHEQEKEIYSEALNRLTIGTLILDGQGKVLQVNRAAQHILQNNTSLSLNEGRLSIAKSRYREELTKLVNAAITWRENQLPDTFVEALRIEGSSGADLGLLIRTAPVTSWYQSEGVPCVIIHLEDFEQDQSAPEQIVARLFRLTRSEARLAAMLADGFTLTEAAVKLNLTESSVRTYSKKIFAKMGVSRQAELVRMILKSIAGLAQPGSGANTTALTSKTRNANL